LGACGGAGGLGAGCVVGGFLKLSINCCKPAADAVVAIKIVKKKHMILIDHLLCVL
jgi:hypothetical protein